MRFGSDGVCCCHLGQEACSLGEDVPIVILRTRMRNPHRICAQGCPRIGLGCEYTCTRI